MNTDPNNILKEGDEEIDDQQLMDYLNNQLPEAGQHTVETAMVSDEFVSDAVDGLQQMQDPKSIEQLVAQLNVELQKHLEKNKRHKFKTKLREQPYTIFAIALMLLLMVVSFLMVKKYLDQRKLEGVPQTQQNDRP